MFVDDAAPRDEVDKVDEVDEVDWVVEEVSVAETEGFSPVPATSDETGSTACGQRQQ